MRSVNKDAMPEELPAPWPRQRRLMLGNIQNHSSMDARTRRKRELRYRILNADGYGLGIFVMDFCHTSCWAYHAHDAEQNTQTLPVMHVSSKLPHNIHCPILPNTLAEKSLLSPNGNTCINSASASELCRYRRLHPYRAL